MTLPQKTFVKTNIFNISTLLAVLGFIIYQARWQETVDNHINDIEIHMPYSEKVSTFVLKDHYTENNETIKEDIKEIKTDIKTILQSLPKKNK